MKKGRKKAEYSEGNDEGESSFSKEGGIALCSPPSERGEERIFRSTKEKRGVLDDLAAGGFSVEGVVFVAKEENFTV